MISLLLLGIDQCLKYLSYYYSNLHGNYTIFQFVMVKNPGVSLGFLGHYSWMAIVSIQIVALVWILSLNLNTSIRRLILAGGISNILDRLIYGYVIDYLHFQIGHLKWPYVVNLADIYLCLALLLWFYQTRKTF